MVITTATGQEWKSLEFPRHVLRSALYHNHPPVIAWLIVMPLHVMGYKYQIAHWQGAQHCTQVRRPDQVNPQSPSLGIHLLGPSQHPFCSHLHVIR